MEAGREAAILMLRNEGCGVAAVFLREREERDGGSEVPAAAGRNLTRGRLRGGWVFQRVRKQRGSLSCCPVFCALFRRSFIIIG